MKRWAEAWSSFPGEHKKRCYQGVAAYALLTLSVAGWTAAHGGGTTKDWQGRIPSVTVRVANVSATPTAADTTVSTTHAATPTPSYPEGMTPGVWDGKAYVAVIVSGLGLSAANTTQALDDLPSRISLAFSPYADDVQNWIRKADDKRHETLILLPMETEGYPQDDPGPRSISSRFSDKENRANLKWLLTQGKGTSGALNLMGSRFLTDRKRLSPIFETLQRSKSIFVETPGIENSAGATIAARTNLPYLSADLQIDATASSTAIQQNLEYLEKIARQRGYAVGIAEPYPLTLNLLKSWAAGLEARGITLAPVSTVWKNKPRNEKPASEQLQTP